MMHHRLSGTIHPNEVHYVLETNETLTKEEGAAWSKLREDHYMGVFADTIRNQYASGVGILPRRVHGTPDSDSD